MKHILVPTDFSDTARAALDYAIELAAQLNARITLLHVVFMERLKSELPGMKAFGYLSAEHDTSGTTQGMEESKWLELARQGLESIAAEMGPEGCRIDVATTEGRPSLAITQFAQDQQVDLIVMGTHGRGPVARFFIGSVTENVIRGADCPVLLVRHGKDRQKVAAD